MLKNKEMIFTSLFSVDARKLCDRKEFSQSFRTDGPQVISQCIKLITIEIWGSKEEAEKCMECDNKTK